MPARHLSPNISPCQPPAVNEQHGVAWRQHLPAEWRDCVIEAFDFTEYREYEMAAKRGFGYDVDGEACYYTHRYLLDQSRSDDDEDFYHVVTYGEMLHAWRLRDERWLIYREVWTHEDSAPNRGFYSFADKMPS